ncbi:MAG TPA: hypothetical protein VIW94_09960 [Acidimicrobiia bacterium]
MTDTLQPGWRVGRFGLIWLAPIAIAIAAAVVAFQLAPQPPTLFEASVTIRPPSTTQDSAAAINLFVNDIALQAESDVVAAFVLDQIPDLDPATYPRDLSVVRQGATSWVSLSFVSEIESVARDTVETLAVRLLDDAARPETDRTQFLLDQASERLAVAGTEFADFTDENDVFDPEVEYRLLLDEISRLSGQITSARLDGADQEYIDSLIREQDRLIGLRPSLGESLLTYRALATSVESARNEVEQARADFDEAQFEYVVTNAPSNLIGTREIEHFVDDTDRLQRSALAGAAGLVLAMGIVIPLAWWLDKRRSQGRHIDLIEEGLVGAQRAGVNGDYASTQSEELRELMERR